MAMHFSGYSSPAIEHRIQNTALADDRWYPEAAAEMHLFVILNEPCLVAHTADTVRNKNLSLE